ncbi:MAG: 4'-phosphopantetheinyl transferase family protein [Geminicoccaceae bacterium]
MNKRTTVHIWQKHLDLLHEDVSAAEALLSAEERERAKTLRCPKDRRRFVLRHAYLRVVTARYLGQPPDRVSLETKPNEPPRIVSHATMAGWHLSLSSSEDQTVVAVAWRRRVGIDIEKIRPDAEDISVAESLFSQVERADLEATPASQRQHAFFRTWARKEAYAKAIGLGFSRDFTSFDVLASNSRAAMRDENLVNDRKASKDDAPWLVKDVPTRHGFVLACCAEGAGWSIAHFRDDDPAPRMS